MQIANALVSIDGHTKVPKYGITAAEIAVLRAIHGVESVTDIEPAGEVKRSNPEELGRLNDLYRGAKNEDNQPILRGVFPIASSLAQTLDDLDLPDEMFKPKTRAAADDKPSKEAKAGAQTAQDTPEEAERKRVEAEKADQAERERVAKVAEADKGKTKPKSDAFA